MLLVVDDNILVIKLCLTGMCVGVSEWECVNKGVEPECV